MRWVRWSLRGKGEEAGEAMNLAHFLRLLDTFGADFRRWPETERDPGARFLAATPEARARWAAAASLDRLFARDRARTADPARQAAITDAALRRLCSVPARALEWHWLLTKPFAATLAAILVAGGVAGFLIGPSLAPWQGPGVPAVAVLLELGTGDLGGLL